MSRVCLAESQAEAPAAERKLVAAPARAAVSERARAAPDSADPPACRGAADPLAALGRADFPDSADPVALKKTGLPGVPVTLPAPPDPPRPTAAPAPAVCRTRPSIAVAWPAMFRKVRLAVDRSLPAQVALDRSAVSAELASAGVAAVGAAPRAESAG